MSQQSSTVWRKPLTGSVQEWYDADTIIINKTGIIGRVTATGTGLFNVNTNLMNITGIIGVTTEI